MRNTLLLHGIVLTWYLSPCSHFSTCSEAKLKDEEKFSQDTETNEELLSMSVPIDPMYSQSPSPHPVCEPGPRYGRSRLHELVSSMDMPALEEELGSSDITDTAATLQMRDEVGFSPIHSACALGMLDSNDKASVFEIVRLLLASGADVASIDSKGNTPLHWAARAGDEGVTQMLLIKNCPPGEHSLAKVDVRLPNDRFSITPVLLACHRLCRPSK